MKRVKCPDWRILEQISSEFYLLCCTLNSYVRYSPLYILTFALCAPCRVLDAAKFDKHRCSYEEMKNIPDKLHWLRHSRGLIQTEVAIRIGVSKHIYKSIEAGTTRQISNELRDKLARFYGVPAEDFEDEFTRFLREGQARQIRAFRAKQGLSRSAFAEKYGIPLRSLEVWEEERKAISHKSWEKYFKGIL